MSESKHQHTLRQNIGLWGGFPVFLLFLFLSISSTLDPIAQKTLAVAVLMAWLWITVALPIRATSLIPIVAFPLLKIMEAKEVVRSYRDSNFFFGRTVQLAGSCEARQFFVRLELGSKNSIGNFVAVWWRDCLSCRVPSYGTCCLDRSKRKTTVATIFTPIMAAALAMRIHPFLLMIPAAVSASCALMLPVATPPNAIIFGSGCVTIPQMAKAGIGLN